MFLAIDIGNSATKFGLFDGEKLRDVFALSSLERKDVKESWAEISDRLRAISVFEKSIRMVAIASVVPVLTEFYVEICQKHLSLTPQILSSETPLGFKVLYDDPAQVGADRLANVAAARVMHGFPAIVVDLGTASTFDVIDDSGNFMGGIIAPGIGISATALFQRAAKLFPVEFEPPETVIARDTSNAMKSGIIHGHVGLIEYLIEKIMTELSIRNIEVIATGGFARLLAPQCRSIEHIDENLALRGLRVIYDQ